MLEYLYVLLITLGRNITLVNKKLNKDDFYVFYNLHDIDYLITDHSINKDVKIHYEQYVNIIVT